VCHLRFGLREHGTSFAENDLHAQELDLGEQPRLHFAPRLIEGTFRLLQRATNDAEREAGTQQRQVARRGLEHQLGLPCTQAHP
jgi:hypothetical protein